MAAQIELATGPILHLNVRCRSAKLKSPQVLPQRKTVARILLAMRDENLSEMKVNSSHFAPTFSRKLRKYPYRFDPPACKTRRVLHHNVGPPDKRTIHPSKTPKSPCLEFRACFGFRYSDFEF
jgi:hypothetical protein